MHLSSKCWRNGIRAAALALIVAGCAEDAARKTYVARVESSVLTEQDLAVVLDTLGDVGLQRREYVGNWITDELLFLEAERRGLADSDELREQLEQARKRLVIGALLEEEVYSDDERSVSEEKIRQVYTSGGGEFALKEDVVNLSFALFSERDAANTFRSKIVRGASWGNALEQVQKDSLLRTQMLQVAAKQYFTQGTLYPQELWKLSRTLTREEVSFVLRTNVGYYVLMVHGVKRQGEIPDLEYVRDEIKQRILIDQRRRRYDQLLSNLREKYTVEVYMGQTDTAAGAN